MPAALVLVLQNWITTHNRGLRPASGGGTERLGGVGQWPKRKPRSALIRAAIARRRRVANIAAPIGRVCPSITCLTPASAGIGSVLLGKRRGRRDKSAAAEIVTWIVTQLREKDGLGAFATQLDG